MQKVFVMTHPSRLRKGWFYFFNVKRSIHRKMPDGLLEHTNGHPYFTTVIGVLIIEIIDCLAKSENISSTQTHKTKNNPLSPNKKATYTSRVLDIGTIPTTSGKPH